MEQVILNDVRDQSYTMRESLRALRVNIEFCGDDKKVIMFTSTAPDEGKSTVTFELARTIAAAGKTVLYIDTDMRKSAMVGRHRAKTVSGKEILGLSHFLSGWKKVENVIYVTDIDNLFMVFAGREVPNPTEILERQNFQDLIDTSRKSFDYVIVDCAPIGAAIDAAVIAPKCDGIVLVVAQDQIGSRSILAAKQQLEASGAPILGCVLNKVRMEKNKYYGKYYGNYYGNYYGGYYGHGDEQK